MFSRYLTEALETLSVLHFGVMAVCVAALLVWRFHRPVWFLLETLAVVLSVWFITSAPTGGNASLVELLFWGAFISWPLAIIAVVVFWVLRLSLIIFVKPK